MVVCNRRQTACSSLQTAQEQAWGLGRGALSLGPVVWGLVHGSGGLSAWACGWGLRLREQKEIEKERA